MTRYANSPPPVHFVCPNCGADVPAKALACPECGADENAGWNETGYAGQGSADPEDSFDYREAFDREFGDAIKPEGIKPLWWITGIIIVVVFAIGAFQAAF